jgi:hypothetical protein
MQLVLLAGMNEDVGSKSDSEIRAVLQSQIARLEAVEFAGILLEAIANLLERELWAPIHSFFESSEVSLIRFTPC